MRSCVFFSAAVLWIGAACNSDVVPDDPAVPGAPSPRVGLMADDPRAADSAWPATHGILIIVPSPSGEGAALVPPLAPSVATADAALGPIEGLDMDLFARAGSAGVGILSAVTRPIAECPVWPQAPLAADSAWRVGLSRGVATGVPLDSIEALSVRDSAQFAASVTLLASRAGVDTVEVFHGLPYVIRGAWRAPIDSGRHLVIALVARTLAIEDDPRSEQLTIVAERAGSGAGLQLLYADRRSASESQVPIDDVLALVRFTNAGTLGLLIERADAHGTALLLLERTATGMWSQRWQGPRTGCS